MNIAQDILVYNAAQKDDYLTICELLAAELNTTLIGSTSKVWHGGPVWFLDDNPVAGYWVRKDNVQLLLWSGQSFDEPSLMPDGKFKAAELKYKTAQDIDETILRRILKKAIDIQWDYKNIVKRRGELVRIK